MEVPRSGDLNVNAFDPGRTHPQQLQRELVVVTTQPIYHRFCSLPNRVVRAKELQQQILK